MLLIVLIIRVVISYINFEFKYSSDKKYKNYLIQIVDVKSINEEKITCIAKICKENNCKDKVSVNIYDKNLNINSGDKAYVLGKITIPEILNNPGEFNYKRYLNSLGIYAVLNVKTVEEVEKGNPKIKIRDKISLKVQNSLPTKYASLLCAMVYGNKEGLDENIYEDLKNIGLSHAVSVSGMNIAILIGILEYVFKKFRINKYIKLVFEMLLVILFSVVVGFGYSVMRAAIFTCIGVIATILNKKIKGTIKLLISLYLIVLINPYCIFNVSVQMSYAATLGIIVFGRKISFLLRKIFKVKETRAKKRRIKRVLGLFAKSAIEIVSITLSAQILSLPIQIIYFNSLAILSVISNLLLSWCVTIVVFLGTLVLGAFFIPIIPNILFKLTFPLLYIIIKVSNILASFSLKVNIPSQPIFIWVIYYIIIFVFVLLDKYFRKKVKIKNKYLTQNIFIKCVIVFAFVLTIVITNIYTIYLDNFFYFFNVGQGSMCYLKLDGKNVLIDCGSTRSNIAYNAIDSYFKMMNIKVVDVIVISHFHSDHVNAVEDIIKNYNVGQICYVPPNEKNVSYEQIISTAKENDVDLKEVYAKDYVWVGSTKIHVMYPTKDIAQNNTFDANTVSMVVSITLNEKTYLFMGDSGKVAENYLMNNNLAKNIYLLLVGHHGSKSSTSDEFVVYAKPKVSIISSKKSVYGHPSKRVVDVLKKYNSKILITENLGAIKIKI